jgi:hypothetical protein
LKFFLRDELRADSSDCFEKSDLVNKIKGLCRPNKKQEAKDEAKADLAKKLEAVADKPHLPPPFSGSHLEQMGQADEWKTPPNPSSISVKKNTIISYPTLKKPKTQIT